MKKITLMLTSILLCMTMLILGPAQVAASAAEEVKKVYISEVKVGMGETSEEAAKELLKEGFTILTDDNGQYADLNKDAGTKSALKKGPNQKIVYFGYKTTEKASDAITDLAVMNMYGNYTFMDYQTVMLTQTETKIKPFVDRFIATLTEYRENLKKPKDSANFKRADYYRTLLNLLTDDDTGGKPLGDLLVNQTKYEMGDEAYNKLSAEEKKNHCDILTLLMQGNGQAVQLMETELAKSADSANNTWLDRFLATDLDTLTENVKKENPNMTPSDVNAELDKRYYDDAKKIRDKWSVFNEILLNYDNAVSKAEEVMEEANNKDSKEITLNEKSTAQEVKEALEQKYAAASTMLKGGMAAEDIVVHDYLASIEFGDSSLLEFFERDRSEFDDEDTIRELYPIVEALSGGQIAGLDFLSIKDMILMAVTDENGFKAVKIDNVPAASIFQDVNREIYEVGGFAVTKGTTFAPLDLDGLAVKMVVGALEGVLTIGTVVSGTAAACSMIELKELKSSQVFTHLKELEDIVASAQEGGNRISLDLSDDLILDDLIDYESAKQSLDDFKRTPDYQEAARQLASKSNLTKYLMAGFSLLSALLQGISIYTSITELMENYKVEFSPVPKYMMDETEIKVANEKGESVSMGKQPVMYKTVPCNRTEGSSAIEKKNFEILKDRNDLNGDVGKQWLSLYSIKFEKMATAIPSALDGGLRLPKA